MPFAPLSSLPYPSPFELRCDEPVGEGERGRPFPLPFLLGSRLNAHESPNEQWPFVIQRMQSPLLELFLARVVAFSFCFTFPNRWFVLVSFSRFEPRTFDFLLEMSLENQIQSDIVVLLVAECRLVSVDLQHIFQLFRLFPT